MATLVTLIAPSGVQAFQARSGNQYSVGLSGTVVVAGGDVLDAVNAGFTISNLPSALQTSFGSAAPASPFSTFGEEGNLYRNIGNPIGANGADTTDDILDGFVLPASAFDVAKRGLQLTFQGKFGATANNKKVRLWLNPTMAGQSVASGVISGGTVTGVGSGVMLYDSTAQTGNAVGWAILAQLFKYGIAGSNTQYSQVQPIFGTTHGGITVPSFLTLPENAAINVVLTGSSSTTGAAADVILNMSEANAMN